MFWFFDLFAKWDVYADLNSEKLGNLEEDSISSMILKELKIGDSWLLLRRNVEPCKECLFSCLCPSISGYEKVIGRYNLCTVFDNLDVER